MPLEALLTEAQVSELTGRGVPTLQKDRVRGTGPRFVKIGRLVRYRPSDINAWLSEHIRRSTSDTGGEASGAETADWPRLVELHQQLADCRIDFREAVKGSMAQASQEPSLDDEHRLLDFGLVPWFPWPRRQNGSIVMRRHVGVGAIDLRIIETGLDDGGLGIVRHEKMRHAADRLHRRERRRPRRPAQEGQEEREGSRVAKCARAPH
jgi:predicted DNA-binding transcriptional regulator AlpA